MRERAVHAYCEVRGPAAAGRLRDLARLDPDKRVVQACLAALEFLDGLDPSHPW